ncbi:hypothetical protein TRFO_39392 [Tritrichomonas foetus]|uniref:Uncharacterized protein n=1 Tax=Tritrichomonas foetus TaxID=1144522 RepID=A0A1J4J836_9EUKA|nr:hypothetical protein TRFO_39392 [Tritrichomonas foetus]|eukprot:OHS94407.1 hypothetical protein TRFO_39392 [Tritrichomonas foetus]
MLLEAKKRNATQELALIQESDDFNHSKENESDVIRLYEENQRLDKELIKAKEIEGILINDISYAYEFQLNAKKMEKELEKMKSDIEKMKSQVSYQSKTSGKLVPKNYLDKENLLNEIKLIEATLTAERVSASKTEETEKNGNLILTKATEDAVNKLCSYIKEVKANV